VLDILVSLISPVVVHLQVEHVAKEIIHVSPFVRANIPNKTIVTRCELSTTTSIHRYKTSVH
jgi:hypothetical protein